MEQSYSNYIESEWKVVYAEAVREAIQDVSVRKCYGCMVDHPSQTQHTCLMPFEEEDLLLYYFHEALDSVDESTVLKTFEERLQRSSIPEDFRNIYKQKFYCADWRATVWKSDDNQGLIFDTVESLIKLDRLF